VRELLKIFLVIVAFFFGLGFVFELNVANLIAGLGLGGLAFALAAKESLENLFASFTIFLDKPFVVGDLVTVNNVTGHIEKVGFRSTRIRTLDRSFLTLPNKFMIDNSLDNLTLRTHRRADFLLAIEYQTPSEKIESFLEGIRKIVGEDPRIDPEFVVRFTEFGESGYHLRVLYFAQTPDFLEFQKVKEEINFQILGLARNLGIAFAYPSRSVYFSSETGFLPNTR
jgi:MscS family membrane protein